VGITNVLCQALQQNFLDILSGVHLISTTKALIQKLRDGAYDNLLENVIYFSE
jgi:hypothetical protein